ncbi:MAG: TetR/AcrR family transcriptional regulator, partial [Clostridia bacterium]|nr:TetR/AcrR family transcriptional regulator [Clostridia bacterium]
MPYRTKNDILVAFNTLAEKKGFERITVQMIADEAGISRATFYRYFKDKYDVMNFNYTKFIEEYLFAGKVQTLE